MKLSKLKQLSLIVLALLATSFQCSKEQDDSAANKCNCQSAPAIDTKKAVEAVVVELRGSQHPNLYVLSTEPEDFNATGTHHINNNILVPCDSLETKYRKVGTRLLISYTRKDCCGVLSSPSLRTGYGCYIDLTAIQVKP